MRDAEIEVDSSASLQGNQCNQCRNQNTSFNESLFNSFNGKSRQNKNFVKRNIEVRILSFFFENMISGYFMFKSLAMKVIIPEMGWRIA